MAPRRPHRVRPVRGPRPPTDAHPQGERLQKVMAGAGIGSRRKCEEFIVTGRVEIDGRVVTELGTRVDPDQQQIRVDGELLRVNRKVYYAVNKPPGVVCTNDDPAGRPRVIDMIPASRERLFTVGRLDLASEGLILVTNDGELANRLAHPRYGVEKTYRVLVAGEPNDETLAMLHKGVYLAEGRASVHSVKVLSHHKQSTWLEIVLKEGKNREIRRILAKVGHKVMNLQRTAIGGLRMKDMEVGEVRRLSDDDLQRLFGGGAPRRSPRPRPAKGAAKPRAEKGPRMGTVIGTQSAPRPRRPGKGRRP